MFWYQPFPVPEPEVGTTSTKAVVGAAVNCMGIDNGSGVISSLVTFNVNFSQSGAAYLTQVDVSVSTTDTQAAIRFKTIAAVQARILEEFGFEMSNNDVILSNYYVGS